MSLLQFVNKAGEVVERSDLVVIASRQPDTQGREEIPAVDVDLEGQECRKSWCR